MLDTDQLAREAVNERVFAIVGASNDREKYGNIIYRDLRDAGFKVYPVNPNVEEVEGDKAYPRLQDLPERADVADVVVPPRAGLKVADDAAEAGVTYFWLQPGAESDDVIQRASNHGLSVIWDQCIMVARRLYRTNENGPS